MKEFILFLTQHWILSSLLILTFFLIVIYELREKLFSVKRFTPQEVVQLINEKKAAIVDLRETKDFAKGYIIHAQNYPASQFQNLASTLKIHPNNSWIILITKTGEVPLNLKLNLIKNHPNLQIASLNGGIEGWKNAGFPLIH